MSKLKKTLIVVGVLSLLSVTTLVFMENRKKTEIIKSLKTIIVDKECDIIDFEYNIKSIYSNMGYYFDKDTPHVLYNGKKKSLSSLNDRGVVYVRISNQNCWECISEIAEIINRVDKRNIKYLLTSPSEEITDIMKETLNLKHSIYIVTDTLELPIEKENVPYLFVIGENNRIENLFIPMKGKEELLVKYLSIQ